MQRRFATLDVFTRRRFTGNPLAVVLDAERLASVDMQAIAREFNYPETVFVLPPQDRATRARLRIFTPVRELPFAGHPTVGTAVLLARLDGGADARAIVLEEDIGPITCKVAMNDADCGHARFDLISEPIETGEIYDASAVAAALNLTLDDFGNDSYVPCVWSAGMPFTFVPLHGLDAVARAAPNAAEWDQAFGPEDPAGVLCLHGGGRRFRRTIFTSGCSRRASACRRIRRPAPPPPPLPAWLPAMAASPTARTN